MDDIVEPDDVVIGGPCGALITESSGSFCFDEQECKRYE